MDGFIMYTTNALWVFLVQILKEWVANGSRLSRELRQFILGSADATHLSQEGRDELISILEAIAANNGCDASGWEARFHPRAASVSSERLLYAFKAGALVEIFSTGVLSSQVQDRYVWIEFDSIQRAVEDLHKGVELDDLISPIIFHSSKWKMELAPLNEEGDKFRRLIEPGCRSCGRAFTLEQILSQGSHLSPIAYRERFNDNSRWGYELHCTGCVGTSTQS